MSNTPSLEPCPFCGGEARHLPGKSGYWIERVICDACHFHLLETGSHTAVERWNHRAQQPNQAQAGAVPLSEREAFEAWIEKDGGDLGTFGTPPNMHYRNSSVNNAWVAWKAPAIAALAAQGGK